MRDAAHSARVVKGLYFKRESTDEKECVDAAVDLSLSLSHTQLPRRDNQCLKSAGLDWGRSPMTEAWQGRPVRRGSAGSARLLPHR